MRVDGGIAGSSSTMTQVTSPIAYQFRDARSPGFQRTSEVNGSSRWPRSLEASTRARRVPDRGYNRTTLVLRGAYVHRTVCELRMTTKPDANGLSPGGHSDQ